MATTSEILHYRDRRSIYTERHHDNEARLISRRKIELPKLLEKSLIVRAMSVAG